MPAMPPQPTCAAAAYKPPSPRQLGPRRAFPASPSLLLGCRSSMRQSRARSIFTSGENRKILPGKGGVPERPNGTVLKTVGGSRPPWVQIPPPPNCRRESGDFRRQAFSRARASDSPRWNRTRLPNAEAASGLFVPAQSRRRSAAESARVTHFLQPFEEPHKTRFFEPLLVIVTYPPKGLRPREEVPISLVRHR